MHMAANKNNNEFEYMCFFKQSQISFERNFHLERYVTSVTKCILLMSAQWCFLEQVNLHFAG
jgi:hypothetical protein